MKKRHMKILNLFLLIILLLSTCASAIVDKPDVYVSLQINNPTMQVNGKGFEIDPGRSTTPIISDNRTLVPIRAIIESFGGNVQWDENSRAVILSLENDQAKLIIDSKTAYFNEQTKILDVAPQIINGRTMLPIRFIAESFNLGVAWDTSSKTVYIIRNSFDSQEYNHLQSVLPAYSGMPYVEINNNIPFFKSYEIIPASFEYYSTPDSLNRCDVCIASVSEDLMPTESRESIGHITPTGWINKKYEVIDGGYLYNRCHLIGFQLTGENDNKRNLITGTRYLNIEGMLTFENTIDDYVEKTKNHVMYRVTPVFRDYNLVADGVLLEAYSVEDKGAGISLCVYCYNIQPGIDINYLTGDSSLANSSASADSDIFYRTPNGKKYHKDINCGGKSSFAIFLSDAVATGLSPCLKCTR